MSVLQSGRVTSCHSLPCAHWAERSSYISHHSRQYRLLTLVTERILHTRDEVHHINVDSPCDNFTSIIDTLYFILPDLMGNIPKKHFVKLLLLSLFIFYSPFEKFATLLTSF